MKKLVVLAVMAAFILGTAGFASAIELKASGQWRVHFNYLSNQEFDGDSETDSFRAMHRARVAFEFIASENLKGVMQLQAGNYTWGAGGGAINQTGDISVRQLFLNFKVPGTDATILAGKLPFSLPSTYGSHILAGNHSALAASIPFNDMIGLTAGWARAHDPSQNTGALTKLDDEVDVFFAVLPIKMDGVQLNPFGVYARWGKDFLNDTFAGVEPNPFKNANQYFAGLNFTVDMLDPIVFMGDFNYGTVDLTDDFKASGFMVNLAAQYKMDMFTPELFWIYESGEDSGYIAGTSDSKRMPTIHTDGTSWAPTAMGFVGGSFGGSDGLLRSFLSDIALTPYDDYLVSQGAIGMWALGLKLGDIQFIDRLTHDLIFVYAQGTNDKANVDLFTDDDKYYEVSFDHTYQIYENLSAVLELGWAKLDMDTDNRGGVDFAPDNAWKAVFGFHYRF
ncbi:outer membrane homotrimeric porin [Desulfonatronum thioautotrophicum]|uniref:outer membrane homotrimeric porin n=1 Tax=Desulfonatronum thioautotrophicum TaxID=617001 RepID=UPI000AD7D8FC|nr:outer membrane homotrimeric porin [Desulfonatronum thioautotrophicum]